MYIYTHIYPYMYIYMEIYIYVSINACIGLYVPDCIKALLRPY